MKVSVIIPAYNHEMYISASIRSVLEQTIDDFELIIINDGSTDNTENQILKYDDPRILYIAQKNQGAHFALNRGIDLAKGEYISILNSDDVYKNNRLEYCLRFLENHKDFSVVLTEVEGINEKGLTISNEISPQTEAWLEWYKEALIYSETTDFLLCTFAKNLLITTSNLFCRKEVLKKVGGFRPLRYAHDWDMLIRLSHYCNVFLMRNILLEYRIHQSNTVHEKNSKRKVEFEVNWLIADNIRNLGANVNVFELMNSINRNHYVQLKVLTLLLMINRVAEFESLLNFNNTTTLELMELFT